MSAANLEHPADGGIKKAAKRSKMSKQERDKKKFHPKPDSSDAQPRAAEADRTSRKRKLEEVLDHNTLDRPPTEIVSIRAPEPTRNQLKAEKKIREARKREEKRKSRGTEKKETKRRKTEKETPQGTGEVVYQGTERAPSANVSEAKNDSRGDKYYAVTDVQGNGLSDGNLSEIPTTQPTAIPSTWAQVGIPEPVQPSKKRKHGEDSVTQEPKKKKTKSIKTQATQDSDVGVRVTPKKLTSGQMAKKKRNQRIAKVEAKNRRLEKKREAESELLADVKEPPKELQAEESAAISHANGVNEESLGDQGNGISTSAQERHSRSERRISKKSKKDGSCPEPPVAQELPLGHMAKKSKASGPRPEPPVPQDSPTPPLTAPTSETAASAKSQRFIVFVGNLPFTATTAQLETHFSSVNPKSVRHITIKDDPKGRSKGYAFLEFDNFDRMKTCLKLYHHSEFPVVEDGEQARKQRKHGTEGQEGKPSKEGKTRRINVELTAGGGGAKSEVRKDKLRTKNEKLSEQRRRRAEAEEKQGMRKAKKGQGDSGGDAGAELGGGEGTAPTGGDGSKGAVTGRAWGGMADVHPSRRARMQ